MSFQVHDKDLLGRNGTITTKSGAFETPHMFPVLDPNFPIRNPQLLEESDIRAVMTNSYLLQRSMQGKDPVDVHKILGFDKIVATDSGAYQILEYGKVGVGPREIVEYQEKINSDIAVILDVPTGFRGGPGHARWTVDETLRRADEALRIVTRKDILWVGPVQGGSDLREVERCASAMSNRDFSIYALGSPTELMEGQHYETLVDMIITAKGSLPIEKPFHLFGAGHPTIFPFLVALGCDLFDSAAYALYARAGRYLTPEGTLLIEDMTEFYCTCPVCYGHSPTQLMKENATAREQSLMDHNLIACFAELRRIREAIRKGRLWDLLELRAHAHPALRKCFRQLSKYISRIEQYDPLVKPHGIFWYGSSISADRPEVLSYGTRLDRYKIEPRVSILLLPGRWRRPFHHDPRYEQVSAAFQNNTGIRTCFYSLAYGPVPLEWDETFPIAQTESFDPHDPKLYNMKAGIVADFIASLSPGKVVVVSDGNFGNVVEKKVSQVISSRKLTVLPGETLTPIELVAKIRREFRRES
jgi:7-cyano-7-deazaguanine tRNA-ribosyltransferase